MNITGEPKKTHPSLTSWYLQTEINKTNIFLKLASLGDLHEKILQSSEPNWISKTKIEILNEV